MDPHPDVRDLDHGFFQFPRPTWKHAIGYGIAAILFLSAYSMYSSGLSIPDIPQISEADRLDEIGDIESYNFQTLQEGYEQAQYQENQAAFVLIPLELEQGVIATEGCYESEDDEAAGPTPQPAVDARKFYVELLKALGFPQGEANRLMSTAADWLDADSNMRPLGAEAGFYAGLPEPRSIGNTFMVTPLELLDVYGYTPEIYRQIAPYVCARPGLQVGSFNVNTMTQRDAPLMVAVYNGQITLESMMAVMRQQSEIEHSDMEAFLSQATLASIDPEQTVTSLLGLRSNYFRLSGEIVYLDSVSSYEAIFQLGEAGQAVLLRRRLGVDE